ncbi:hypothetical protein MF271_14080 [Deinococcus sp. KNUC1210]|uniref:AfsR/SARP family transcriptional regulator n=1 Tax=Deinococcus sp. KNUC1210 TaxID=2917691 RepID=UPI001EF0C4C4|nr:hypothetical protein [Deinococcus sp. KNUC1210]ULH15075.1 hypothetical protein MF271_14080 [Deinococcus sp. KNUC1210]
MPPRLFTLGQLSLAGSDFRREKPLLLLAYLCVQGPQVRRNVARLFWPGAADPMNSLSVAVAQLRRAAPDLIEASETQVLTRLTDDAAAFRSALQRAELEVAGALYRGPFLATLTLGDLSEELEEWIMTTREGLADAYRSALLTAARGSAEAQAAAELSARAFRVIGTTPPLPEQLREGYRWLSAAQHPDAERVRQEAQELGLKLAAPNPPRPCWAGNANWRG